ncbi:DUF4426 domain-containing protein [Lacimicrobium alkaliphilum]|uniref:Outer membrane protein n=1 Tax=Lacimicrobium alkaliphilum TaxID=1526571 RepID=A0ABQ1QX61_9ALTE|nr:DUF4426 domain-containing protein [Lacimicrobium alkaliphilum]GGD49492.1 outer membrane protein [Lacimicrobium alkaliphilum]
MKRWLTALLFCGLLLPVVSHAEQKKTLGNWDVHYMVLTSTFLTPEVARSYGIQRSKYNALINVSVLDKETSETENLLVTGNATNLIGTRKKLEFREVIEGDSIYYIATLSFRDQEQYRFEIDLNQGTERQTLKFSQKLYSE